ncbi:unnamed protein product [Microthlaspi erraticum]|uniref:Uncharacterized protein n=1 Tax=Microthlaspi erraticum TaxID=1685480 RepID=A0A6D2J9Y9_9BRAS|nr:unnamed protein product [Microthlaspi erraticum]
MTFRFLAHSTTRDVAFNITSKIRPEVGIGQELKSTISTNMSFIVLLTDQLEAETTVWNTQHVSSKQKPIKHKVFWSTLEHLRREEQGMTRCMDAAQLDTQRTKEEVILKTSSTTYSTGQTSTRSS